MTKVKVTLAYPWRGPDGVNHRADTTLSLPRDVGQDLIIRGRARAADSNGSADEAPGDPEGGA